MPTLPPDTHTAIVMAGIPATNRSLYHAIRLNVADPAALCITSTGAAAHRLLILRDIEMGRARLHANADRVACPADYATGLDDVGGLSGDRETATAQALAHAVMTAHCERVIADRTLPLIYIEQLQQRGIAIEYDPDLGVANRRAKDEQEVTHLRQAQAATEAAIEMACKMVARATPDKQGVLHLQGNELTSQAIRLAIDVFLLTHGYTNPRSIVAAGRQGSDCHALGAGPIRTGQPVIIDIFPQNRETKYNGDCTRTVVHGDIPDEIVSMHKAVLDAKQAAEQAIRSGTTGEKVHLATTKIMQQHGYAMGFPTKDNPTTMPHGTGHGIGLDVHEPPLLDLKGPELVVGDALTIEPGLYNEQVGGVRIEDMVIVTEDGCENLNALPQSLTWN